MSRKICFLVLLVALSLAVAKVVLAARLATTGTQLLQITNKGQSLEAENLILEEEILKLSSLSRISEEAKRLSFSSSTRVVNLATEVPIALNDLRH